LQSVQGTDIAPGSVRSSPPQPSKTRDLSIIYNLFVAAHNISPNNPVLSPDGALLATFDQNGFVTIYRLAKTYDQLMAEEADAQATLRAQEPSSIGLQPTPTPPFGTSANCADSDADHHAPAARPS
jgi:hypothetical protein